MPIIVSKIWTSFFSLGRANAVTIFPFIFLRDTSLRNNLRLINQERIHLVQALEMAVLPFYICYLLEFFVRYLQHRSFDKAYRHISFEQEAFAQEANLHYLAQRKLWAFRKYITKKA